MTNHPFIKANYPHHEGVWGWGQAADQVVMMIRNIRKSMVECEKQRYQSPNYFAPCLTSELPASFAQTMISFGILDVSLPSPILF